MRRRSMARVLLYDSDPTKFSDGADNAMRNTVELVWGIQVGTASWAGLTESEKRSLHTAAWEGFFSGNVAHIVQVCGN